MTILIWAALIIAVVAGSFFAMNGSIFDDKEVTTVTQNSESASRENETPQAPPSPPVVSPGGTLDLSGRAYTTVPANTFTQTNIEKLDLSRNELSEALPAEVRLMTNLRSLDLSDNNFTGVPAEIGQLSKLEYLDLSNNPITGLPNELGNLKNLKELDLRGTNYSTVDLEGIRGGLSTTVLIRI
jgi:Leucine-rich repeat (LRR) protein